MRSKEDRNEGRPQIIGQGLFWAASVLAIIVGALLILCASLLGSSTRDSITLPRPQLTVPVSGTAMGLPTADLNVEVYSDFQCHYCQKFATTIERQFELAYVQTGKARFTYKHVVAFGDQSQLAAEASECAAEQNAFWPYHDALMELGLSPDNSDLTIEKLLSIAQGLGLNVETFRDSLSSHKYKDKVIRDTDEARSLGLTGIPALFINGVKADNAMLISFDKMKQGIDKALAEPER